MKLYLLSRIYERGKIYDCFNGHIIRADTEDEARAMASDTARDEGRNTWLDPTRSTCVIIEDTGKKEIILSDYHAG